MDRHILCKNKTFYSKLTCLPHELRTTSLRFIGVDVMRFLGSAILLSLIVGAGPTFADDNLFYYRFKGFEPSALTPPAAPPPSSAIKVPDISDFATTKYRFGVVGVTATPFTPRVVDKDSRATWSEPGTSYSINHDIASDAGLSFDPKTGTISGTPTDTVDYPDFTMTVTAADGKSDSTTPIEFVVEPYGSLIVSASQKKSYFIRIDELWHGDPIEITNAIGDVTFSIGNQVIDPNWSFDTTTGAFSQNAAVPESVMKNQPADGWPIYIDALDESGRMVRFWYNEIFLAPLSVSVPSSSVEVTPYLNSTNLNTPIIKGASRLATLSATGLPSGMKFDPSTGSISGIPDNSTAEKVYKVTLTLSDPADGAEESVSYDVNVKPAPLLTPIISDVNSSASNRTMLFNVGTSISPFVPQVTADLTSKAWDEPNTVFTLNHDLSEDTGLSFDASTGRISGVATNGAVYEDLIITVTSSAGKTTSTKPFWFGVRPSGDMVVSASQKTSYDIRMDAFWQSDPIILTKAPGRITFSYGTQSVSPTWSFDTATGVFTQHSQVGSDPTKGMPATGWPIYIDAYDVFGRTVRFWYNEIFLKPLTISVPSASIVMSAGQTYGATAAPTVSNVYGSRTFSVSGLPQGVVYSSTTGAISGTPVSGDKGKDFTISVQITDSRDGANKNASYTLQIR